MTVKNKFKNALKGMALRATTIPYFGRAVKIANGIWRLPETRHNLIEHANMLAEHANTLAEHANTLNEHANTLKAHISRFADYDERVLPDHDNLTQSIPVTLRNITNRIEFIRRELMFEIRHADRMRELGDLPHITQPRIISEKKVAIARNNQLRLNLGYGHAPLDGYINIDGRELSHVDVIADLTALPFEKGEVDEIFSSHVLEHFPQEQLRRQLLPYWGSLLKPGGIFRAVVPDTEFMIREYCNNSYPYACLREATFGVQDNDWGFHFNMFSRDQLSTLLTEAGFSNVQFEIERRPNGICFEMTVMAAKGNP